jgi:hypothetical protein
VRTDDCERAECANGDIGEVHGATFSATQPASPSEDFRERAVEGGSHCEHHAVPAIGPGGGIPFPQGAAGADGNSFLPLIEVRRSTYKILQEEPVNLVFERADFNHAGVETAERLTIERRRRTGRLYCSII